MSLVTLLTKVSYEKNFGCFVTAATIKLRKISCNTRSVVVVVFIKWHIFGKKNLFFYVGTQIHKGMSNLTLIG